MYSNPVELEKNSMSLQNLLKDDEALNTLIFTDAWQLLNIAGDDLEALKDASCLIISKVTSSKSLMRKLDIDEAKLQGIAWEAIEHHLHFRGLSKEIIQELHNLYSDRNSKDAECRPLYIPDYICEDASGKIKIDLGMLTKYLINRCHLCRIDGEVAFYNGNGYVTDTEQLKNLITSLTDALFDVSIGDIDKYVDKRLVRRNLPEKKLHHSRFIPFLDGIWEIDMDNPSLQTLKHHHHSPDFIVINPIPFNLTPNAQNLKSACECLLNFADGDHDVAVLIAQAMGTALYREPIFKRAFMLVGPKSCGKSYLISRIMPNMYGKENGSYLSLEEFNKPFGQDKLKGKRFNIADDNNTTVISGAQSGKLKKAISGEPFNADLKHKTSITMRSTAMLYVSVNEHIKIYDKALFERFIYIPFTHKNDDGSGTRLHEDPLFLESMLRIAMGGLCDVLKVRNENLKNKDTDKPKKELFKIGQRVKDLTTQLAQGADPVHTWLFEKFPDVPTILYHICFFKEDEMKNAGIEKADWKNHTISYRFNEFKKWIQGQDDLSEDDKKYWTASQNRFVERVNATIGSSFGKTSSAYEFDIFGEVKEKRWDVFRCKYSIDELFKRGAKGKISK